MSTQSTSAIEKKAKILKGIGGLYTVLCEDSTTVDCSVRGVFRHDGIKPYIGDNVIVLTEEKNAVIDKILPRKNELIRPPVANTDLIFIVSAASCPEPDTLMIDKLITICEHNEIEPVLVFSKTDIDKERAEHLRDIYKSCGFDSFALSSLKEEGISEFKEYFLDKINGKQAAFAGASGVGKSSLMNSLFPSLCLETGNISRKIERGKHTTRAVSLYPLGALTGDETA